MKRLSLPKIATTVVLFCLATVVALPAQTFTTLFTFNGKDGAGWGNLIQGRNGNFYGAGGLGQYGQGEIYEITPEGKLRSVYSFCPAGLPCTDGSDPSTPIQAANGNFYGVTRFGGAYGEGTVFELTPGGKLTVQHSFCAQSCADGYDPWGFVQGFNGKLYGSTANGGAYDSGTIFEITPAGEFTTIYNFCSKPKCADGLGPGALALAPNGNLYGNTYAGPCTGCGTVFEVTPAGKLTVIYTFQSVGAYPQGVTLGADGSFYGTTYYTGCCALGGIAFKTTSEGKETTLYTFCSRTSCADGELPQPLIQGTDGNLYGTTSFGGLNNCTSPPFQGCGTIFSITPTETLSTLYSFCPQTNCPDGEYPAAAPMQATDGKFYGTTTAGGDQHAPCLNTGGGCGTIYSFDNGLAPFIESNPTFGRVGYKINILGNNLIGTTSVTFNGIPATFTVASNSYLRATVPTGATTGTIQVATPGGTLSSNVAFHVIP